jgi:hypothetical protein
VYDSTTEDVMECRVIVVDIVHNNVSNLRTKETGKTVLGSIANLPYRLLERATEPPRYVKQTCICISEHEYEYPTIGCGGCGHDVDGISRYTCGPKAKKNRCPCPSCDDCDYNSANYGPDIADPNPTCGYSDTITGF